MVPAQVAAELLGSRVQGSGYPEPLWGVCRFSSTHALQGVFDWVDLNASDSLQPGSYNLVTQYPKRTFLPSTAGSLADAGLTAKQEAMFIQLQ